MNHVIMLNKGKDPTPNTIRMIQIIVDDINEVRRVNPAKADALTHKVLERTCILNTDIEFDHQDKEYSRHSSRNTSSKVAPHRSTTQSYSKVAPIGGRKRRTKHRKK